MESLRQGVEKRCTWGKEILIRSDDRD